MPTTDGPGVVVVYCAEVEEVSDVLASLESAEVPDVSATGYSIGSMI